MSHQQINLVLFDLDVPTSYVPTYQNQIKLNFQNKTKLTVSVFFF